VEWDTGVDPRQGLTERVIGLAIDVHRSLGQGLLESAYETCLCFEPADADITFTWQATLPIIYKGVRLEAGYRLDIVVE
jgi:GxxExxY protein